MVRLLSLWKTALGRIGRAPLYAKVVGTLEKAKGHKIITATQFEEIKQRSANRLVAIGQNGGIEPTVLPRHRASRMGITAENCKW